MELRSCPLSFNTEGLDTVNHALALEFLHTTFDKLEPKIDKVLTAKSFIKIRDGLYESEDGRRVTVCRLGATIRAIWQTYV